MSWPFSNVVEPNFKSGAGLIQVPQVLTPVPNVALNAKVWLLGVYVINNGNVQREFQVFDGTGGLVTPLMPLSGGSSENPALGDFIDFTGLQWIASGTDVWAKAWGYI